MRTNPRKLFTVALVAGMLGAGLSACGTIESEAESVFLHQNRVSSALMQAIIAAEMDDPVLADKLYDEEAELQLACRPIQKAGYQNLHYGEVDQQVKLAVLTTLRDCAVKSSALADLLWQVDPTSAEGYLDQPRAEQAQPRPMSAMAQPNWTR